MEFKIDGQNAGKVSHLPGDKLNGNAATIDYNAEVVRKLIHLCSLSIPTVYFFTPKPIALWILGSLTITSILMDLGRFYSEGFAKLYNFLFHFILRNHELASRSVKLTGATNLLISAFICVAVFPKIIVVNAFAVLIISDITSALIGRRWGRQKFFSKSREGSIAFFLSAIVVVLIAPKVQGLTLEYIIAIVAAGIATIIEAASIWVDDNISVPIGMSAVMWMMYALLLPKVNLFGIV
jgi:dolichol kinase